MELLDLLNECLSVEYKETGVAANYAIKRSGGTIYLFFQGSKGLEDWKTNFNFPAKAYERMGKTIWFAHRGFLKVWKEIEPKLARVIADKTVSKIISAGYSHGGAIAMLCHEYVWYNRPDLRESIEGYGFGCPRVFWGMKTDELKKRWDKFTVVRNIDDIVTHLPPSILGYSHMGTLLKIGKKGSYSMIEAHLSKNYLIELGNYEKNNKNT